MTPTERVEKYHRLLDEIVAALESTALTAAVARKLDAFELLHGAIPLQERGGDRVEPQRIDAMIERLRQRIKLELGGGGKLRPIPITHTRPHCTGYCDR